MKTSIRTPRLVKRAALVLAIAAVAAPSAQAIDPAILGGPSNEPATLDGPSASGPGVSVSGLTFDNPTVSVPQGWENRQFGPANLPVINTPLVVRPDDRSIRVSPVTDTPLVVRPDDRSIRVSPTAVPTPQALPAPVASSDGFNWGNAIIGGLIGTAFGLMLAALGLFTIRRRDHLAHA